MRELNFLRFGYPWWECPRMNPLMIPRNNCTYLPHTLTCYTPHTTLKQTPHTHMLYTYPHTYLSEKVKVLVTESCLTLCNLWTVVYQAPLSMEFSRQEHWSGLPFLSPGESSLPRDWTQVSCTVSRFFTIWATWKCVLRWLQNRLHPRIIHRASQVMQRYGISLPMQEMFRSLGQGESHGERNGNPLQYSFLENPAGRADWWAIVPRVTKESDMT